MKHPISTEAPSLADLISGGSAFLVVFTARWSPAAHPLFKATADELADSGIPVISVDVDTNTNYADKFSIVSVPTVIYLVGNDERRRFVGATSPLEILISLRELGLISGKGNQ